MSDRRKGSVQASGMLRGLGVDPAGAAAGPSAISPFRDAGPVSPGRVVPILEAVRDASSVVGEEIRLLRARVQDACRQRRMACIALTSSLPGEGKSTLSIGLAAALARQPGQSVVLIEMDLRRPSITRALQIPQALGLSEWLHGHTQDVPVRQVEPGGFSLIVAGQAPLEHPELLGSARMASLLEEAKKRFHVVLIDLMPLLPVADAALVQDLIDGFVMVVRSRVTPRDAVQKGLRRLTASKVIGLVLNDYNEILPTYTSYAYKRYGMAYGYRRQPDSTPPSDPGRDDRAAGAPRLRD